MPSKKSSVVHLLTLSDRLCLLACALILGLAVVLGAQQNAAVGERSIAAQLKAQRELMAEALGQRTAHPQDNKQ
jgi:hypothetical protein